MQWFKEKWNNHEVKKDWIPQVRKLVEDLFLEYKGKRQLNQELSSGQAPRRRQPKVYTSARAHKRLKTVHQEEDMLLMEIDNLQEYLDTNVKVVKDDEDFDVIQYWQDRYTSQPDLARFALDILAVPPMSDECERLFSSCKILLEDRRSRLQMDIIEANEVLRHSFGPPRRDTFDDKDIGKAEGEPQSSLGIPLIEAAKARAAADVAAIAAAQAELPDNSMEDSEEALALIEGNGDDIAEVDAVDELDWM